MNSDVVTSLQTTVQQHHQAVKDAIRALRMTYVSEIRLRHPAECIIRFPDRAFAKRGRTRWRCGECFARRWCVHGPRQAMQCCVYWLMQEDADVAGIHEDSLCGLLRLAGHHNLNVRILPHVTLQMLRRGIACITENLLTEETNDGIVTTQQRSEHFGQRTNTMRMIVGRVVPETVSHAAAPPAPQRNPHTNNLPREVQPTSTAEPPRPVVERGEAKPRRASTKRPQQVQIPPVKVPRLSSSVMVNTVQSLLSRAVVEDRRLAALQKRPAPELLLSKTELAALSQVISDYTEPRTEA